jgi:Predicted exporters of the RND superfamily
MEEKIEGMEGKLKWNWKLVKYRKFILLILFVFTVLFGFGLTMLNFQVRLADLLPPTHPFVKVTSKYTEKFGGIDNFVITLDAVKGDIFKAEILKTIFDLTDEIVFYPDAARSTVTSIGLNKAKSIEAKGKGEVEINALMFPEPPSDEKGIAELKSRILGLNAILYKGIFVSDAGTSALIAGTLKEGADYRKFFDFVRGLKIKYEKKYPNLQVKFIGHPLLMGWIYYYIPQMTYIFLITFVLFLIILLVSYRSVAGVTAPILCGVLSAIWGMGFIGIMGYNMDPLLIVIPFLIGVRSFSHGIQITARYIDEYNRTVSYVGDKHVFKPLKAAAETIDTMLIPNASAIGAEIGGFVALVFAGIISIQVMALTMSFWMIGVFLFSGIFVPLLCIYLPKTVKIKGIDLELEKKKEDIVDRIIYKTTSIATGLHKRWAVLGILAVIFSIGSVFAAKLKVGDLSPGSPILWPNSEYNQAAKTVTSLYSRSGSDTYSIYIRGANPGDAKTPAALKWIDGYDIFMRENMPEKFGGTISFAGLVKKLNREFHGGDPKFYFIPPDRITSDQMVFFLIGKANPGDYATFIDIPFQEAQVTSFFRDHFPDTINQGVDYTKDYIKRFPPPKGVEIDLASGSVGLNKAINDELERSHWPITLAVLLFIFVVCVCTFRSLICAVLLVLPILVARAVMFTALYYMDIGISVASLTVTAVGLGIGVDFGIYIVARIKEAYAQEPDLDKAVFYGMATAGKAVFFTAAVVIVPVALWYFLSSVKFWGEMGFFLSGILLCSLFIIMFFLPAILVTLRPKFITTQ